MKRQLNRITNASVFLVLVEETSGKKGIFHNENPYAFQSQHPRVQKLCLNLEFCRRAAKPRTSAIESSALWERSHRGYSSDGRACALHAQGPGIDTLCLHFFLFSSTARPYAKSRTDASARATARPLLAVSPVLPSRVVSAHGAGTDPRAARDGGRSEVAVRAPREPRGGLRAQATQPCVPALLSPLPTRSPRRRSRRAPD